MTLLQVYNLLKETAEKQPNIHSVVDEFLKLNREDAKYSSIVIQQTSHSKGNNVFNYGFYLGYVDRLTADKSNEIEIQSTAIEVINNIIYALGEIYDIDTQVGQYQIFTQRFTAECAGAYVALTVSVPEGDCVYVDNSARIILDDEESNQ